MVTLYHFVDGRLVKTPWTLGDALPERLVWADIFEPTTDEEHSLEALLGLDLPTRAEMREIEASSRLYEVDGARFMTATVVSKADTPTAEAGAITFVMANHVLVSLRYSDPLAFSIYATKALKLPGQCESGETALAGLIEAIIDRAADVLENVAVEMDGLSRDVFRARTRKGDEAADLEGALRSLGRFDDLTGKVRESLASIERVVTFLTQVLTPEVKKEYRARLKTMARDIRSIAEHASALAQKVNFLLDATLGMINIEQTRVIKILSVAATVFLPPTLMASIYGMNFDLMPELKWDYGYPMAIVLMVVSAVLPYLYFKRKGWL
ncbi:magnesium/cobalt transporter CorA [Zavarzinia compransoris]|uniref:Magnesium transport protein CorA n=1 Tax=Zavarzinia compransoris TaxID=1264899 RepID=A0A317E3Z4_9PROT|nr:magnesium/cobalt transporter CorA [Zavarzinia compransoris]PWR21757.1 magnesium and cobalt transport protein CorA [Zavarzinia compransoris]TDP45447.1 magnesium transporter [Zavarzinia compransoris]